MLNSRHVGAHFHILELMTSAATGLDIKFELVVTIIKMLNQTLPVHVHVHVLIPLPVLNSMRVRIPMTSSSVTPATSASTRYSVETHQL